MPLEHFEFRRSPILTDVEDALRHAYKHGLRGKLIHRPSTLSSGFIMVIGVGGQIDHFYPDLSFHPPFIRILLHVQDLPRKDATEEELNIWFVMKAYYIIYHDPELWHQYLQDLKAEATATSSLPQCGSLSTPPMW